MPGSLTAYRTALEMGADLIEVDVRRQPDGVLVCSHDRAAGGAAPSFADVLALVVAADAAIHVDVKEPGYEAALVAVVAGALPWSRVYFTTGDEAAVSALRSLGAPALLTLGSLLRDALPFRRIRRCDALGVAVQFRLASPWLRAWCSRRGLAVLVWTVNDDRRLRRLLGTSGVTAVVTDRPGAALALRDKLR